MTIIRESGGNGAVSENSGEHQKIACDIKPDRAELVRILAEQGYTVRIGRVKSGKSNAYTYYVEYWKEDKAT